MDRKHCIVCYSLDLSYLWRQHHSLGPRIHFHLARLQFPARDGKLLPSAFLKRRIQTWISPSVPLVAYPSRLDYTHVEHNASIFPSIEGLCNVLEDVNVRQMLSAFLSGSMVCYTAIKGWRGGGQWVLLQWLPQVRCRLRDFVGYSIAWWTIYFVGNMGIFELQRRAFAKGWSYASSLMIIAYFIRTH